MDFYRAATELYTSSLRALEQRSTAFLFAQSLLAGAFAIIFVDFQKELSIKLFIPVLGLTIVGLVLGLLFSFFHWITSKDAAYWRAYMRFLENIIPDSDEVSKNHRPWQLFYQYVDNKERGDKEGKKLCDWRGASIRLPAPLLWLATPILFTTAWICVLIWVIQLKISGATQVCVWLWVLFGVLCVVAAVITYCIWKKATDNIYEDLNKLPYGGNDNPPS